jgi:hypothetical protein
VFLTVSTVKSTTLLNCSTEAALRKPREGESIMPIVSILHVTPVLADSEWDALLIATE